MARILRQVTVVRDGMHNGFTDLQHWQGAYWVGYRKGTAHASMDGEACVSVSVDRARFREAARVKVPGDNRDPKLFPLTESRLAMTIPTWLGGYQKRDLRQYIVFSEDGFTWEKPIPILGKNRWLWRIRRHAGRYYGLIQDLREDGNTLRHRLTIALSDDLLRWDDLCSVGTDREGLNESDICWQPTGEAWLVARSSQTPNFSFFGSARPPYTAWKLTNLKVMIHAPILLEHAGALYVAGRRNADLEKDHAYPFLSRTGLGVWKLTRGRVEPVLRIPATCDCSYPGLIKDPDGRICLTYYSQHAYDMGVVPRPFRLEPDAPHDQGRLLTADDVYFAELQLP